jgi:VanZ family protein
MFFRICLVLVKIGIGWLSLTPRETITIGNDKISHFIAYGALMWNVGMVTFHTRKHFLIGLAGSLAYGALMEFLQDFVPGRFMSFNDMLANAGGVFTGCLLTLISYRFLRNLLGEKGFF